MSREEAAVPEPASRGRRCVPANTDVSRRSNTVASEKTPQLGMLMIVVSAPRNPAARMRWHPRRIIVAPTAWSA
jgi:hypothetical protein